MEDNNVEEAKVTTDETANETTNEEAANEKPKRGRRRKTEVKFVSPESKVANDADAGVAHVNPFRNSMHKLRVVIEFTDPLLGTCSGNPEVHSEYIASKAPTDELREQEVKAISVEDEIEKAMTVFPRTDDGDAFVWDYQIRGFFKESCQLLRRSSMTGLASKDKYWNMFKKKIDGLVFVHPREVVLQLPKRGFIGHLERPLRASTAQGERVALAHSETVPAGTRMEFEVLYMDIEALDGIIEWLDYGVEHGLGQWRNSGHGRFVYAAYDGRGRKVAGELDE